MYTHQQDELILKALNEIPGVSTSSWNIQRYNLRVVGPNIIVYIDCNNGTIEGRSNGDGTMPMCRCCHTCSL